MTSGAGQALGHGSNSAAGDPHPPGPGDPNSDDRSPTNSALRDRHPDPPTHGLGVHRTGRSLGRHGADSHPTRTNPSLAVIAVAL